jgi:predicted aspartyl protease
MIMKTKSVNDIILILGAPHDAFAGFITATGYKPRSFVGNKVQTFFLVMLLILVPAFSASAQTTSVPVTRVGSSLVVEVSVQGKTRHFLLDTGAGLSVLSPDTAGWSPVDVIKAVSSRSAVGLDGATHSMGSTTATLELGQTMIVTPAAVADLNALSKALNIKLDGILGQDVLSQFSLVTIDYKNKQLIFKK